jgi:hypothetical protein
MDINNLEPRYKNYWLDLIREENKEKEETERKMSLAQLYTTIDQFINRKNHKP